MCNEEKAVNMDWYSSRFNSTNFGFSGKYTI